MAAAYRKAIVAAIGVAAIVFPDVIGADLQGGLGDLVDGVLAVLTAVGVFTVRNEPVAPDARV